MIAEGEYRARITGSSLTWTDEWTFDPAYDAPVVSDVNRDFDEVHLTVDGPQWVWFGFYAGEFLPGDSFTAFVERSASPERLALEIGPTAEVVVSRIGVTSDGDEVGALIIRVTLEGYDFLVYEEYRPNGDGTASLPPSSCSWRSTTWNLAWRQPGTWSSRAGRSSPCSRTTKSSASPRMRRCCKDHSSISSSIAEDRGSDRHDVRQDHHVCLAVSSTAHAAASAAGWRGRCSS